MAVSKTGRNELEKLRLENARLSAEHKPSRLFRRFGVITLVAISIALLTAGNLLFWFGNTIVKPDRFTDATAPIIKDSTVQQTMALYTTNKIFESVDVQKITEEALPPKADFLAPQLTTQLKSGTEKTLQKTLAKPKFQEKWNGLCLPTSMKE
jgi:hypothetical protein